MSEKCGKCSRIGVLERPFAPTPVCPLSFGGSDNELWIIRDDLLPFSFGGNKARKAAEFYRDILEKQPDVIMTYGSHASNHCRIIANMAAAMGLPCHILSPEEKPEEDSAELFNARMVREFGAKTESVPVEQVASRIEQRKKEYLAEGMEPYFIMGGGHGNLGTAAYVKCWDEIAMQQQSMHTEFDYIFHASGTGTTQAGLICGKVMAGERQQAADPWIVGISIARPDPRGGDVVRESVKSYLGKAYGSRFREDELIFEDRYRCGGYGQGQDAVRETIRRVMQTDGIPLDPYYTGKAFRGMLQYLQDNHISGRRILFIHTGGTPLYFDSIREEKLG